jgi:hypothetical protein
MTQTATRFETTIQQQTAPIVYEYQKYYRAGGRYYNPYSGETISRGRYTQLRREAGVTGRTRTLFQRPDQIDQQLIGEYQQQLAGQGVIVSPKQVAQRADFQVILANLSDESGRYDVLQGNRYVTRYPADSPKAWALVQLGRREPDWTWPVGESDEHK